MLTVFDATCRAWADGDADAFADWYAVGALAAVFLGGADPKDPFAGPLHADLRGLPPIYVQVGGDETLLGESLQLEETARRAGADVRADVFIGQ
ncbi:alpha/beta hydrolase fold domain-containing protein [Actinomadura nitritigenes]|uniref:alpha/beta hydrolase fold domain-containing protein n=1 Tax=Actinomadura nitritigenes TaxID=134602 RepID=UPI003D8F85C2